MSKLGPIIFFYAVYRLGAHNILIPEIPYNLNVVADYLLERRRRGSRFSIIAVAEGAVSVEDAQAQVEQEQAPETSKKQKKAKPADDLATVASDNDDYLSPISRNLYG